VTAFFTEAQAHWPAALVSIVRFVKGCFGHLSQQSILGVPLDLPARVVVFGVLYSVLRRKLSRRWAAGACVLLLPLTELFEIVAVQSFPRLKGPGWDDVADVLSGLVGIALAAWLVDARRRSRATASGGTPEE